MSDQSSLNGAHDETAGPETAAWSANGSSAGAAQAVADPPDLAAIADGTGTAEEIATDEALATDIVAEASELTADAEGDSSAAGVSTAEAAVEPAPEPAPTTAAASDDGTAFLGELVRAMQSTATAERTRITEDTDRRRDAHLAAVEARRQAEATAMRELADTDLKAIDAWADEERQRIQDEHGRRATALQTDLETSLAAHGAKIGREIEGVEAAITTYRSDVDTFFAALEQATDPVAIARHASQRPVFPALDAIDQLAPATADADPATASTDETAVTASTDETPAPLGVMAPAGSANLAKSWAAWSGIGSDPTVTEPAGSDASTSMAETAETGADTAEPVALEASAVVSGQGKVLQSTPISRPMSWLRRDHDSDRQNDR